MIDRIKSSTNKIYEMMSLQPYTIFKVIVHESQSFKTNNKGITVPVQNLSLILATQNGKESTRLETDDFGKIPLDKIIRLDGECDVDVSFYFEKSKKTIKLPKQMNINLITFLSQGVPSEKPEYCCIQFMYELLYKRGFIKNDANLTSLILHDSYSEEKSYPGTAVYLYKKLLNEFTNDHFAIYIGENYYISMFGKSGLIAISDLDAMKKCFDASECVEVSEIPKLRSGMEKVMHSSENDVSIKESTRFQAGKLDTLHPVVDANEISEEQINWRPSCILS